MAMPASGCIGIITCPNSVACTSISQAVSGNVTPPKSLVALGSASGNVAPYGMTEYYNFTYRQVSISCLSCLCTTTCMRCCGCLSYSPTRVTNDCLYPAFTWSLCKSTSTLSVPSCVQVLCNGVSIYCCCIGGTLSYNCSGTFALRCVDYNDCIDIITLACRTGSVGCHATAIVTISSITNCVGAYCLGSITEQQSYSGIVPV